MKMLNSTARFVYIIKCEKRSLGKNPYKIGMATDLVKRLFGCQGGCPFELIIFGWVRFKDDVSTVHAEDSAHKFFARFHIRGEWYRFNDNQVFNALERIAGMVGAIECSRKIQGKTITSGDDYERYYIDK